MKPKTMPLFNPNNIPKECKITFIIGNGFDLGLGMNTRYTDVYREYIKKQSQSETIAKFKDDLQKDEKHNYENWSDFEIGMAEYAKTLPNEDALVECVRDFKDSMVDHLRIEEQHILQLIADQKNYKDIANEFLHSTNQFYEGLIPNVANILKSKMNDDRIFQYITFNYTTVFDELLAVAEHYYRKESVLPLHIHGQLEKDVVLGIDNEEQLYGCTFSLTRKGKRAFVKTYFNEQYDNTRVELAKKIILESDIICVYGFAMGETDNTWVWLLSDWLLENEHRHLIVYQYNSPKLDSYKFDEIMDIEDNLKIELLKTLQIEEEHVLNQIHIPVGRDIFNFKEILYRQSIEVTKFNPLATYENKNFIMN